MKQLSLWDGKDLLDKAVFTIPDIAMDSLVTSGLFKLPTCTTHDGHTAIDLKIFIVRVQRMIGAQTTIKNRVEIVRALAQYRYLYTEQV